ncbi:olfactory receptor 5V1-like [Rhinatrema bivittatum]|uniref:olfactory receptor 5V1-like n=1 Tax=Rhinatrema bivittatum TaxID=194408 RepID=UPI00112A1317|nr:olfactory receptor 5V1-like [Rhinatrema bivittatum]
MTWGNQTFVAEFILLGLSESETLQRAFFVLFLVVYMIALMGNLCMIVIIRISPHLHTPMYFFLSNLSFLDMCYVSVTVPKMLEDFLEGRRHISFSGCMTQLFFLIFLAGTEVFLLTIMAYDRYVAICNPLRYSMIVTRKLCVELAVFAWLAGFLNSFSNTVLVSHLPFCGPNVINHFSCDIPPLLKLSCSDTFINEITILIIGIFFGMSSFLLTLVSYIKIIACILKMNTVEGRHKAFSTCASHVTVVCLFYVTATFRYMRPASSYSLDIQDRVVSVLYSIVTPMLNPIIYSLRNKEVKRAVKRLMGKIICLPDREQHFQTIY